jgi:hypothetical protein
MTEIVAPRATKLYEELYGKDVEEEMPYFVDLVRAIKTASPGRTLAVTMKMIGYPLNPKQTGNNFFLTIEGFFQGIALEYFARGATVKHGAPIPIKRVLVANNGKARRMFASTFAILSIPVKEGDEFVRHNYIPFLNNFVRAGIDKDGIYVLDDNDVKTIRDFTMRLGVLRGAPFELYYDYLRLGKKPPTSIFGFVFDERRGPMHNLIRYLDYVVADFMYIFNFPDIENKDMRRDLLTIIYNAPYIRPAGYGYLGFGVIADYVVSILNRKQLDPDRYLFANYNDKYWIALRPIPRDVVDKNWIVAGRLRYRSINPNPPYYSASGAKTPIVHYLPGVIFREKPDVEWERW